MNVFKNRMPLMQGMPWCKITSRGDFMLESTSKNLPCLLGGLLLFLLLSVTFMMGMFARVLNAHDRIVPRGRYDNFQVHLYFIVEGPEPNVLQFIL
jgi:hypothetical protein